MCETWYTFSLGLGFFDDKIISRYVLVLCCTYHFIAPIYNSLFQNISDIALKIPHKWAPRSGVLQIFWNLVLSSK